MLELLKYSDAVICVLLIALVLIQNKNVSLNLSSMGWGMGPVSKRGAEKVLHNATIVIATLFVLNSIALFLLK